MMMIVMNLVALTAERREANEYKVWGVGQILCESDYNDDDDDDDDDQNLIFANIMRLTMMIMMQIL